MIGKVFREGGINLIYGESGSGKTVSTVMALNTEDIEPILLDFDNNDSAEANSCKYLHVDGSLYLKNDKAVLPTKKVIIVDTWTAFESAGGSIEQIKSMAKENTVIIVDHNMDWATKRDTPMMDSELVNHMDAKLWLEVKTKGKEILHILHVKKCRGYKGKPMIQEWMRDGGIEL